MFKVRDNVPEQEEKFENTSKTGMFYEAERMPRQTGRIIADEEASGEKSVITEENTDKAGFATFGPYSYNPTGIYEVVIRMKSIDVSRDEPVARIEIATDKGNTIIKERAVSRDDFKSGGVYDDIEMEFSVDRPTEIEYRIDFSGKGSIVIDYIYVIRKEQEDPLTELEAEELFHSGRVERDRKAVNNEAVHLIQGVDPEDLSVYGPYRRYPPGDYSVSWRIRYPAAGKRGPVAVFEIVKDCGAEILSRKELVIKNSTPAETEYTTVEQNVHLDRPSVLEFKLFFCGNRDIWVDNITIKRDNT
jgi:hypothetical protein